MVAKASRGQDLSPAQRLLAEVFGYYKHQATPFEATMWTRLIEEFGDESIERFLSAHVQRSSFAPRVNEAMALLRPGAGDSMNAILVLQQAVGRIGPYNAPEFSDPAIAGAVEALGGWVVVNDQMPDAQDRFAWDAFFKRFDAAYRVACGRLVFQSAAVAPRLRGLHDLADPVLALEPPPSEGAPR